MEVKGAPVWIAGLPDKVTLDRGRCNDGGGDPEARRFRCVRMNEKAITPACGELLAMAGVTDDEHGPGNPCVHALAWLEPSLRYSCFSDLPRNMEMQREYMSNVANGCPIVGNLFFFEVKAVYKLPHPRSMPFIASKSFFTDLPGWFVTDLLEQVVDSLAPENIRPWMREDPCTLALRVPKPYAALVASGRLRQLAAADLGRSSGIIPGVLSIGWADHHRMRSEGLRGLRHLRDSFAQLSDQRPAYTFCLPPPHVLQEHSAMSEKSVTRLLGIVRRALSRLRWEEDEDGMRNLHDMMACAQHFVDKKKALGKSNVSCNTRYNHMTLINSVVMCQDLKNDSKLRKTCIRAAAIFGQNAAEAFVRSIIDNARAARLPSIATISRARGRLDVSHMLETRKMMWRILHLQNDDVPGMFLYIIPDKSPQGGREYEMVVVDYVKNRLLPYVPVAIATLEQRRDCTCTHNYT